MLSELRFAVRRLAHAHRFTATALLILMLGIGATATMFSATNAVLLKPLPYPQPDRLVSVRETRAQAGVDRTNLSTREYRDWTRGNSAIEDATIVDSPGLALAQGNQGAVRLAGIRAMRVSPNDALRAR